MINNSDNTLFPPGYLLGNYNGISSNYNGDTISSTHKKKIYQSAMAVATAPGRQLFMTMFMLWMSGKSLQIFSIMMLGMAFWTPLQRIIKIKETFARYETSKVDITQPKMAFIVINLIGKFSFFFFFFFFFKKKIWHFMCVQYKTIESCFNIEGILAKISFFFFYSENLFIYFIFNLHTFFKKKKIAIGVACYKANSLGLLPNPSDFLKNTTKVLPPNEFNFIE